MREGVEAITKKIGLTCDLKQIFYYAPVPFDPGCVEAVRRAAKHFGYSHRDIVSGAGHDACYMARVAPTSMVFTPCVDGDQPQRKRGHQAGLGDRRRQCADACGAGEGRNRVVTASGGRAATRLRETYKV